MSTDVKTTESLLTSTRKANYKLRKSQFEYASAKVTKEKADFDKNMDELNQLRAKNKINGEALNEDSSEILGRGLVTTAIYSTVDKVSTLFNGTTEVQDITQRSADLAALKQNAIEMQKALVAQSEELAQKKETAEKARQRVLDVETNSLKKEIELEEEKIKQLNQSQEIDVGNEPDMAAAVNKWEMNNAGLAASRKKIIALKEKQTANINAKNDANEAPRTPANSVITSCPSECEATKITVNCKHYGRIAQAAPNSSIPELHVISASMKTDKQYVDMISIAIEGSCGKGKSATSPSSALAGLLIRDEAGSHCPYAAVSGGEPGVDIKLPGTTDNTLDVYVYSPQVEKSLIKPTWLEFFKYAFIPKEEQYTTYTIRSKGCDGTYDGLQTHVYAHTYVKWAGEVSVAYSKEKPEVTKKVSGGTEIDLKESTDSKWEIAGKISGIYDGSAYDIGLSLKDFFPGIRSVISGLSIFMNRIDELKGNSGATEISSTGTKKKDDDDIVKFTVNYPKVVLEGSYDTKEDPKGNMVDTEFKIALKLDPLIGVKADIDILRALLHLADKVITKGTVSKGLKFIKYINKVLAKIDELEKTDKNNKTSEETKSDKKNGVTFKAGIVLTAEGNLGAELNWSKVFAGEALAVETPAQNNTTPAGNKGKIGGEGVASLKLQLKGEIKADATLSNEWFELKAAMGAGISTGGARGGGPSELALKLVPKTDNNHPAIGGSAHFNGLTLYYMAYATASLNIADNINDQENTDQQEPSSGKFNTPPKSNSKPVEGTSPTINENATAWAIIPPRDWPPANEDPKTLLLLSDSATDAS